MNNKGLIKTSNINTKVLVTEITIKQIKEPEQLQPNE